MQRRILKDYKYEKNMSHLSPYHQKVQKQKESIKQKQVIKSIYLMGHLQKMELNAINNKSMRINMVAKKAQKMYKKIFQPKQIFSPKANQLKIDNRLKQKTKIYPSSQRKFDIQFNTICQTLINEYLAKVKGQNLLLKSTDRKSMIEEACLQIKQKLKNQFPKISIEQEEQILSKIDKNSIRTSLPYISTFQIPILKKKKRPKLMKSITQMQCNDSISKLKQQQTYFSKKRYQDQKFFLRRMKFIVQKNKNILKNGVSQRNRRVRTEVQKLGQISSEKRKLSPIKQNFV